MTYRNILVPRCLCLCKAIEKKDCSIADIDESKDPVRFILPMYWDNPIMPFPKLRSPRVPPDDIVPEFPMDERDSVR